MLDDEKKKLIAAEERYRNEIANKLRDAEKIVIKDVETTSNKIWAKIFGVLNSNVGMLVISSVLISGGATLYQNIQHQYEARSHALKEIMSCEFEIANRLYIIKHLLSNATTVADAQLALAEAKKSIGPIKPEYENVGLAILYFNLYQLTGIRRPLTEQYVKEIERVNLSLRVQNPRGAFDKTEKASLLKIINAMNDDIIEDIHHLK